MLSATREAELSEFNHMRREMFFKPSGGDKFVYLGSADKVDVTETIAIGDRTLTHTYRHRDAESMKQATNDLAGFVIGRRDPVPAKVVFNEDGTWRAESID